MARTERSFRCSECGYVSRTWAGKCPSCQEWGSVVEEAAPQASRRGRKGIAPSFIPDISVPERCPSGLGELDRVLGGGSFPARSPFWEGNRG